MVVQKVHKQVRQITDKVHLYKHTYFNIRCSITCIFHTIFVCVLFRITIMEINRAVIKLG